MANTSRVSQLARQGDRKRDRSNRPWSRANDRRLRPLLELLEDRTLLSTNLVFTNNSVSGIYGGTANLAATLTSNGQALPNEFVNFTLDGHNAGSATTDANGLA